MPTEFDHVKRLKAMLEAANTADSRVDVFIGEPDAKMDTDGKAHAYVALYPNVTQHARTDEGLCGSLGAPSWGCQATCAGGDVERALRAVTRVQQAVIGQQLYPDSGIIRSVGDLGGVRKDQSVTPHRQYVPIDLAVEA